MNKIITIFVMFAGLATLLISMQADLDTEGKDTKGMPLKNVDELIEKAIADEGSSVNITIMDNQVPETNATIEIKKDVAIEENKTKEIADIEAKEIAKLETIKAKAIAKAEAIKAKAIAEAKKAKAIAEITEAKAIAKAIKTQEITELEAVKTNGLSEADAKEVTQIKLVKIKTKAIKKIVVTKAEQAKEQAESVFEKSVAVAEDKVKDILGIEENTTSEDTEITQTAEGIIRELKIKDIKFKSNRSSLTREGKKAVRKLDKALKKHPYINIEIAGHTDSDGSNEFNEKLSQERVNEIKKILVSKGVEANRLTPKGYGETEPLVPNTSKKNKQKNRRVEINIISN